MAAERKTKVPERLHPDFKQLPGIHGKHGSSTQTKNVTEHPLSDLFGKYDGAIWDEIFVEIDADRHIVVIVAWRPLLTKKDLRL